MSRSTLLTLFLWLLCIGLTNAQEIVVDTKLDSTAILIGQQVRMTTRVACKKGDRVIFPEYKNGYVTQGLEMLQAGNIDTAETDDGKRWELTRKYTLTAFDSAVYVIPKTEIEVNGRKYLSKNDKIQYLHRFLKVLITFGLIQNKFRRTHIVNEVSDNHKEIHNFYFFEKILKILNFYLIFFV